MNHIELITQNFLQLIEMGQNPIEWDDLNARIQQVGETCKLSNALKLILTSTGSVTKSLEVLSNNAITVSTIFQNVREIDAKATKLIEFLDIEPKDRVNFREVWLTDGENNYVFAMSITPIKRLADKFKDDLTKADVPIGRLIAKYSLECRREIYSLSNIRNIHLKNLGIKWNSLGESAQIPYRCYNIINNGCILMCIIEFFHPEI